MEILNINDVRYDIQSINFSNNTAKIFFTQDLASILVSFPLTIAQKTIIRKICETKKKEYNLKELKITIYVLKESIVI